MVASATQPDDDAKRELRMQAGAWLRSRREACGISQRELAEKVGALYYTFISQIEAGRGRIPAERYAAWANALDIDSRAFAICMLKFYEPATHALIFNDDDSSAEQEISTERRPKNNF